ncbi:acid sphingomyelinase-like phosphodiesterase 3b [Carettochelys insculpta]|uniref:acid sphingomyelinase-like phosphodiesterase 3b n=1 Tax=Carettochelys insculpta TaxID=44489 RepID=UPI003EBE4603
MDSLRFLLLLMHCQIAADTAAITTTNLGHFWHITDLHLDPAYRVTTDPLQVCPSAGSQPVPSAGRWGHYLCDSPWSLINNSIYAMKEILPDPDFILWTGDDTPHVPDEKLREEVVLEIIANLTGLIKQVFPGTTVYPVMGNHDFHPKNQFPAETHRIYNATAELWHSWLNSTSILTFKAGAFYCEKLPTPNTKGQVIVLNTNLYYDSNHQTAALEDPTGQFQWLDDVLTKASKANEMVYIVGHIPPGFFEKKRNKPWFREHFNKRYTEIVQQHHRVIAAQFFGHHHTDSFRMFYSDGGSPVGAMFIAPGVTPWKTTLPGVHNGANNPGIRVFDYDRGTLQVKDMVTYYLNLTHANLVAPKWEQEYRLTDAFQVPDGSASSMHRVLEMIEKDKHYLQQYHRFNSVTYDLTECDERCQTDHVCAIREVDFMKYDGCIKARSFTAYSTLPAEPLFYLCLVLNLLYVQRHLW